MPKLKPCPFCGGKRPRLCAGPRDPAEQVEDNVFVECMRTRCGARGPVFTQWAEFQRPDPVQQAIDAWNKRAAA